MYLSGDYDISKRKTWLKNSSDLGIKQRLATGHFKEVANGDAILIANDDKAGQQNYIGPNGTMEWGLAYYRI